MANKNRRDTDWVYVSSSNVHSIRHIQTQTGKEYLLVRFRNRLGGLGDGGTYSNCPKAIYTRMLNSPSKGKFVHRVLKGRYSWTPGGV